MTGDMAYTHIHLETWTLLNELYRRLSACRSQQKISPGRTYSAELRTHISAIFRSSYYETGTCSLHTSCTMAGGGVGASLTEVVNTLSSVFLKKQIHVRVRISSQMLNMWSEHFKAFVRRFVQQFCSRFLAPVAQQNTVTCGTHLEDRSSALFVSSAYTVVARLAIGTIDSQFGAQ